MRRPPSTSAPSKQRPLHTFPNPPWNPPGVASSAAVIGGRIFGYRWGGDFRGAGGFGRRHWSFRPSANRLCARPFPGPALRAVSIACDAFSALIRSASSAAVGSPSAGVPDSAAAFSRSRKFSVNSSR